MPGKELNKFFFSIVFPSILAIGLFILSIYLVIIPSFEGNIMDEKKVMISELTNTAWSLLEEFDLEYKRGNFTKEEAQKLAASRIEQIRYGRENKDYFWIIDLHPTMIMHPYTSELIDSDLTDYQDHNGKRLFVEAKELVGSTKAKVLLNICGNGRMTQHGSYQNYRMLRVLNHGVGSLEQESIWKMCGKRSGY